MVPLAQSADCSIHGVVIAIRRPGSNPVSVVGIQEHFAQLIRGKPFEDNVSNMWLTMANAFLQCAVCMLGFPVIAYDSDQRLSTVTLVHF